VSLEAVPHDADLVRGIALAPVISRGARCTRVPVFPGPMEAGLG
jgi:hypothetical protein